MKKTQSEKIPDKIRPQEKNSLPDKISGNDFYFNLIGVFIIIFLGIIIYSNSFSCSFHFDDFGSIVENPKIRELSDLKTWWNYSHNRFIPYFSFALNYHFGQLDVWGYHLVNLIIHLLNAFLVWCLVMLIFISPALKDHELAKHKKWIALFTALLFVSHPLATQSVTYIVQRLASMVTLFYLSSVVFYLNARLTDKGTIFKILLIAGSIVSAVFAMFTKENAYTLPFAILLLEFFFIRTSKFDFQLKNFRHILLIAGFIGFILFVILKFSFSILKPIPPTQLHDYTLTPYNYLFTQFSVIVKYIQLMLFPLNQMLDYDFHVSNNFFESQTLFSFIFLLVLIILGIKLFKNYRILSFGIFWFFLCLSVESSIIPIKDVIFEHRTYLPSVGFFLILSSATFIFFGKRNIIIAVTILSCIIGLNSFLTYQRNQIWKDDFSLWNDNVKKSPNNPRALTNRGFGYKNRGQWDLALSDYNRALIIKPDYSIALSDRGVAHAHFKQWDKAIADYSKAININPKFTDAYCNRGAAFNSMKEWDKAISDYSKAIEINSKYSDAYYNRGIAHSNLNDWDKAISDYSKSISINPDHANAYCNRGIVYGVILQWDTAIEDYTKAIAINPDHATAYSNRGVAFTNLQQWDKAIADYSKAIAIKPDYLNAYFNRGNAFENMKEWDKAIADYTRSIEIDPEYKLAYSRLEFVFKKSLKNKVQ